MKTTRQRLAEYRRKAEECRADFEPGKIWRYWKSNPWQTPNNARATDGRLARYGAIFSESIEQYGDNVGDAHNIARIGHTGWYCDQWQSGLIRGAVCRVRCAKGTLYMPATYCTEWDGTIHYPNDCELVPKGASESDHAQAQRDAAMRADQFAEWEAEESREFYAKDQAEQDILEAREHIHELNKKGIALIQEIKANGRQFSPHICEALRDSVRGILAERAEQFRIIEARESNFWSSLEGF